MYTLYGWILKTNWCIISVFVLNKRKLWTHFVCRFLVTKDEVLLSVCTYFLYITCPLLFKFVISGALGGCITFLLVQICWKVLEHFCSRVSDNNMPPSPAVCAAYLGCNLPGKTEADGNLGQGKCKERQNKGKVCFSHKLCRPYQHVSVWKQILLSNVVSIKVWLLFFKFFLQIECRWLETWSSVLLTFWSYFAFLSSLLHCFFLLVPRTVVEVSLQNWKYGKPKSITLF